jgi:hypothetical protein
MVGDLLGRLQLAAVLHVGSDAGCPECVIADFGFDLCSGSVQAGLVSFSSPAPRKIAIRLENYIDYTLAVLIILFRFCFLQLFGEPNLYAWLGGLSYHS